MLSGCLNHLDIFPVVSGDPSSCVYANFRANLDTNYLTRWSYGINEVWETPARPAAHIENSIPLFEIKQLDRLLTHRFYEGKIEIGKRANKADSISKVRGREVFSLFLH